MKKQRMKQILFLLLGTGLLAICLLFVAVFRSDAGCNELVQFGFARRDCYLLRAPLVWFARERPRWPVAADETSRVSPLPVPKGKSPDAIEEPPDENTVGVDMAKEHQGAYLSFNLTWNERVLSERNTLAYVAEGQPFIGEFEIGVFMPDPPPTELTCLVDFIQRPCAPDVQLNQDITLDTGKITKVPIRIEGLAQGFHDVVVIVLHSLADMVQKAEDPEFFAFRYGGFQDIPQVALRKNIAVAGDLTPPAVHYERPRIALYWPQKDGVLLSPLLIPWTERRFGGGTPLSRPLQAQPGQPLKLYLHLFNPADSRVQYAIVALINHTQIPVWYQGKPRLPFYVMAKAGAWHPIPIEITAPVEPGRYEVRILVAPDPFRRVDVLPLSESENADFLGEFSLHAAAILVDVAEK